jgi:predicted  nucleic acid-binding Zn-ribbon protein
MVYRQSKNAIERARERLGAAKERLASVRVQVDLVATELSDAQRKRELARLLIGAAAASVRRLEALIAASPEANELDAELGEARTRLEQARAELPLLELVIGQRREALRCQRREMGVAERERAEAERELARLER